MKISLASHGGWGAALRRHPLVVDTDELPAPAAAELRDLASAAARAQPDTAAAGALKERAPEAMTYEIRLDDGDRIVVLKGSDVAASAEFEALRNWLQTKLDGARA